MFELGNELLNRREGEVDLTQVLGIRADYASEIYTDPKKAFIIESE